MFKKENPFLRSTMFLVSYLTFLVICILTWKQKKIDTCKDDVENSLRLAEAEQSVA